MAIITRAEARTERLEQDVENILHNIMQRRNFTVATRDAIVECLEVVVDREIRKNRERV